jgi:flavin-dependent dehydrogenase
VAQFVAFLERRGTIPVGLPAKFRGHAYLLYGEARRPLYGDAVLLIGDAAGLAYARSGEGIRPAIESGLLAAQTVLEAGGTYSTDTLAGYEQRVVARFGPRQTGLSPASVIPQWIARAVAGRVVANVWFLQTHQPPLRCAI